MVSKLRHSFLGLVVIFMVCSTNLFSEISFTVLQNIFKRFDIDVATIQEANAYAQAHFLIRDDQWFSDKNKDVHQKMRDNQHALLQDLKTIGMIDCIMPFHKEYVYALVMGSFKDTVSQRLDFLNRLYDQEYKFETIVLLGGERPLYEFEKIEFPETITTEIQMMKYLCDSYDMFKDTTIVSVNAPMIQKDDGTLTRPTTDTTLAYFAEIAPHKGSCLVISNNPYVIRQTKVARRVLNQTDFPAEGCGSAFEDEIDIEFLMDEFARRLYEECKLIVK